MFQKPARSEGKLSGLAGFCCDSGALQMASLHAVCNRRSVDFRLRVLGLFAPVASVCVLASCSSVQIRGAAAEGDLDAALARDGAASFTDAGAIFIADTGGALGVDAGGCSGSLATRVAARAVQVETYAIAAHVSPYRPRVAANAPTYVRALASI